MSNFLSQLQYQPLTNFADNLSVESVKQQIASIQNKFSSMRPPQEFLDYRRFSKPQNFGEIQQRLSFNLPYFQANYIAIILLLSVYALVTNALLLFVLGFTGFGIYFISKLKGGDLELPMGRLTTSQLYTGLAVIAIPLGFLASPISTMMWLIGTSSVTVLSHASLMEKPIETVFEETV